MNTDRDSVLNMDGFRRSIIIFLMCATLMLYMYQRVKLTDTNWIFLKQSKKISHDDIKKG